MTAGFIKVGKIRHGRQFGVLFPSYPRTVDTNSVVVFTSIGAVSFVLLCFTKAPNKVLSSMNGIDPGFLSQFKGLPTEPVTSLRGGDAIDEYREAPEYDPTIDRLSPEYFETYFCGITYLDAVSWRYYLPYLLGFTLQKISDPGSMAVDHFLSNLRPPDREPPRFGSFSPEEQALVVFVLDRLAFSDESVWQDPAMVALEEYWGPGALYR